MTTYTHLDLKRCLLRYCLTGGLVYTTAKPTGHFQSAAVTRSYWTSPAVDQISQGATLASSLLGLDVIGLIRDVFKHVPHVRSIEHGA